MSSLKIDLAKSEKQRVEYAALLLVRYLNRVRQHPRKSSEHLERIKRLLLHIGQLKAREQNGVHISNADEQLQRVNADLATYPWTIRLLCTDSGLRFLPMPATEQAGGAVLTKIVIDLASRSLLDRVQPCGFCGTWFFGVGMYCGPKCKQKAYRATPEYKENARKYHRDYYRYELSPVTRRKRRRKVA